MNTIKYGRAICYSGYRKGQTPVINICPTYKEILEDLKILEKDFDYIRMYDSNEHTRMTLEVIKIENINLKVLLGMNLLGEISNPQCSWGGEYDEVTLAKHIEQNQEQLEKAIALCNAYKEQLIGVSAGNESVPEWNENLVSPARVLYFVNTLKEYTEVPVTYCDNIYYWKNKLVDVANAVDFISIHIYPVWHSKSVIESIGICVREYNEINNQYPNKQVLITETGWPTKSNDHVISSKEANELNQKFYNTEIEKWSRNNDAICFFFEAFDEEWKGSNDPSEPEKNWGHYLDNRKPKLIMK